MYLTILIAGLAVFSLFRLLYFLNKVLPLRGGLKHYWGYLLPVVELASWLGFLVWCFRFVYDEKDYTPLIIVGVLALLLILPISFLLRDFLFGVILKLQRKMEVGLNVEIDGMVGKIVKAGYFSFDLKTKNGNLNTIPYHTIRSKVISKSGENINLEKYKISFKLHSDQNEKELGVTLKSLLLTSPWVAPSQPQYIGDPYVVDGQKYIDVFIFTISEDYISNIRNYVISNLDGLSV